MLIDPLDVLRFIGAYAIVALVPGYALATLARPRADRIERAAFAIPCAYALVAIIGIATTLLHLPFDVQTYGIVALPIVLWGGIALWRERGGTTDAEGRWWLIPIGVALVQLGAVVVIHTNDVVPAGFDVLSHVIWTDRILHAHAFPISLLSSQMQATDGGFYPPVFHSLNALILGVTPMPTYRATFYTVLASNALLPMALFIYVRAATGHARLGALAAIASLAFEPLPFFVLELTLYTFTVSLLFTPLIAIALRDGLVRDDRRSVALAALLGIGLFYTHPTEFVTTGLLTMAVVPGALLGTRRVAAWLRALAYGVGVALVWAVAAWPALTAVHNTMVNGAQVEISNKHDFAAAAHTQIGPDVSAYMQWVFGRDVAYGLLAITIFGMAWSIIKRRHLGLVVAQVILTLVFLDSISYNVLNRFYILSFPWALWERLAPTHYWFTLPLAAIGLDRLIQGLRYLRHKRSLAYALIVALPLVILGLLLPLDVAARRARAYAEARKVVAPADLGSIAWLARNARNSVVVNDEDMSQPNTFDIPSDAGRWMPVLGGPQPLFWRDGEGPGAIADRVYVLEHIADVPLPAHAVQFIEDQHVRFIFYGAIVRPTAKRHLSLARLLADRNTRIVYSSVHTCRPGDMRPLNCPTRGSYVFALETQTSYMAVARNSHRAGLAHHLSSSQSNPRDAER